VTQTSGGVSSPHVLLLIGVPAPDREKKKKKKKRNRGTTAGPMLRAPLLHSPVRLTSHAKTKKRRGREKKKKKGGGDDRAHPSEIPYFAHIGLAERKKEKGGRKGGEASRRGKGGTHLVKYNLFRSQRD